MKMNKNDIDNATGLTLGADTTHEDAIGWYSDYGWHLSTEDAGDVCVQAVEYGWLDDEDDAAVVALLMADEGKLSEDEAESIVDMARSVRSMADAVEGLLDAAVEAYDSGDFESCRDALLEAYRAESDAGDAPATQHLAGVMLVGDDA